MPNTKTGKVETIKKLKDYLESDQEENDLLVVEDFNLITDEQDRSPPHADDLGLTTKWNELEIGNELVDRWRFFHPNDRQFTYAQADSLGRIDRMYVERNLLKNCLEWTIESNWGISDHQMTTVRMMKHNTLYIGKGLWKLDKETIKWPSYVNRIRKLLVEVVREIENTNNKKVDIWMKAKNLIKSIGIEKTNNRRRQIQRAERLIKTKLEKKMKLFKDTTAKRQEIEKLTRRIDESKGA